MNFFDGKIKYFKHQVRHLEESIDTTPFMLKINHFFLW